MAGLKLSSTRSKKTCSAALKIMALALPLMTCLKFGTGSIRLIPPEKAWKTLVQGSVFLSLNGLSKVMAAKFLWKAFQGRVHYFASHCLTDPGITQATICDNINVSISALSTVSQIHFHYFSFAAVYASMAVHVRLIDK